MEEKFNNLPNSYKDDIKRATKILKENGAKEVFIFGSIANGKIAGILMFELENKFDLIDLDDKDNRFSQMLLKIGGLLKVG